MPKRFRFAAIAALWVTSMAASAGDETGAPGAAQVSAALRTAPSATALRTATSLFSARRAADDALSAQRGGTEVATESSLQGVVTNNQTVNSTTGGNQIGGGALTGVSGVPVVIQNTGNNVLIQSSTIVNVQVK